mmetsp:Transcript_14457/g.27993  ORF Transcript_14457/g.27993 Transcript_14457/m.27993 type:complete len:262 (-) Transcript_14457:462-1247(-)
MPRVALESLIKLRQTKDGVLALSLSNLSALVSTVMRPRMRGGQCQLPLPQAQTPRARCPSSLRELHRMDPVKSLILLEITKLTTTSNIFDSSNSNSNRWPQNLLHRVGAAFPLRRLHLRQTFLMVRLHLLLLVGEAQLKRIHGIQLMLVETRLRTMTTGLPVPGTALQALRLPKFNNNHNNHLNNPSNSISNTLCITSSRPLSSNHLSSTSSTSSTSSIPLQTLPLSSSNGNHGEVNNHHQYLKFKCSNNSNPAQMSLGPT